jgi:hypothetical protein
MSNMPVTCKDWMSKIGREVALLNATAGVTHFGRCSSLVTEEPRIMEITL